VPEQRADLHDVVALLEGNPDIERVIRRRLREARLTHWLTLAAVAAKTGLSKGTISKIENGQVSSPISTYYRIGKVLGLKGGGLFSEAGEDPLCFVMRGREHKPASRRKTGYTYSSQGLDFRHARKKMEPFILTYTPARRRSRATCTRWRSVCTC
jgi:transcriptional regulator with XRE-family HTH domain